MIALRSCVMTLAILSAFAATAPDSRAQDFPQVRDLRAHRGNYAARSSRSIKRIVIHTSEGSESSCVSWFLNPRSRVSSHYLVSHQGRITRLVPDMSVAYHARHFNSDTLGIENEGFADRNDWTNAQYQSLAALVRGLCNRYRIPKDRHSIVGHYEVTYSGKVDPGRFFDWNRFMALVRGGSAAASAPLGGFSSVVNGVGHAPAPGGGGGGGQPFEVCTVSALRLRSSPSTSSTILGMLHQGQKVRRIQREGVWALVQIGDHRAWVHTGYTRQHHDPQVTSDAVRKREARCATKGHEAAVFSAFKRGPRSLSRPGRTKIGCTRCCAEVDPDDVTLATFHLLEAAHQLDNERDFEDHQLWGP